MRVCVDMPASGQVIDPSCIRLEGWAVGDVNETQLSCVEARQGGRLLGRTQRWFARPDVLSALGLTSQIHPGFALKVGPLAASLQSGAAFSLHFHSRNDLVGRMDCHFPIADHRRPVSPATVAPAGDIIPSVREGIPDNSLTTESGRQLITLLKRTLVPGISILEANCGQGWIGRALGNAGFRWHGAESSPIHCTVLSARGLPHTRIRSSDTPFRDAGFDAVLVVDPKLTGEPAGLPWSELKRIAPRTFIAVTSCFAKNAGEQIAKEAQLQAPSNHLSLAQSAIERLLADSYPDIETIPFGEPASPTRLSAPSYSHLLTVAYSAHAE